MARRKADELMETGIDAFASLDERRNSIYIPWISAVEGINCDEAGRRNYIDISKPAAGGVINCDEAAEIYRGVLFKRHGPHRDDPRTGRHPKEWQERTNTGHKERGLKKKSIFGFSFGFPKAK